MDYIEVAEFNAQEAAKFSYDGLNLARTKAHQLLLLLLGGGAGMATYGSGIYHDTQWLGAGVLFTAAVWFAAAMYLALCSGLPSAPVRAWAETGFVEQQRKWETYAVEVLNESAQLVDPLLLHREARCAIIDQTAGEYRAASSSAFRAIDQTYVVMALSPVFGGLVALAVSVAY